MTEDLRTRDLWRTVAMMLIAVLVLLVVALASLLQPTATTGASDPAAHAISTGGSGLTDEPYLHSHAEVVATYRGSPR